MTGDVGSGSGVGALAGELAGSWLTCLGLQLGLQAPTESTSPASKTVARHPLVILVERSLREPIASELRVY